MEKRDKIFLAAPFHNYVGGEGVRMKQEKIELIERVLDYLRSKGYEVHNAHEREEWGKDWYSPDVCTPLDFQQIRESDILIAMPGNPPSGGVHIEIGWATALDKRVILLLDGNKTYSNLVVGLGSVGKVDYIKYETLEGCLRKLGELL